MVVVARMFISGIFVFSASSGIFTKAFASPDVLNPPSQEQLEESEILRVGSISTTRYITSGILGTYLGFGIGQAVQGRFSEKGFIFLTGELVIGTALVAGIAKCSLSLYSSCEYWDSSTNGLLWVFIGLRIWEIVDLWATPIYIDRRLKEIEGFKRKPSLSVTPVPQGASINLSWKF